MPPRDVTVLGPALPPEPTLAYYLAVIWRGRALLLAATVVGAAVALALSIAGPRVYESTVTFAATQSKIGENTQTIVGTASFRPMIESLSTAAAVLRDVGLDKPPHSIRPSDFLDKIMSVTEVRGTNLMRVTIVYTDPALAATMAKSVADHAVQTARDVSATEAKVARDMIGKQLEEARKALDEADRRLRDFKQQAQLEAVKKDVEAQLAGRLSILDLMVSIASERAKLTKMEEELKNRRPLNRSESGSKVYDDLDTEAATTRAYLASLEKQRTELVDVRKLGAAKLAALTKLYDLQSEMSRREVEQELAEKIYMEISHSYEVASLQVVGRSAELSVIDPAVPADRPVSRQVPRNTFVGAVAGLSLAVAAVLLWQAAGRMRPLIR